MKKKAVRKKKRKNRADTVFTAVFCFFIAVIPLLAALLYGFGVPIPKIAFGIYGSVVFITAGILFIIFAVFEKFGFGKEGAFLNKTREWKWLSKKQSKENTVVYGSLMIAAGIFFAVLTFICL